MSELMWERGLLNAAIARSDIGAVDHEWLLAQRARALTEIGRDAEAQEDAFRLQGVRLSAPGDATATALAASGAILLFNTSTWSEKDIKSVVTGADTAASWWRAQMTSRGLWAVTDRSFEAWAQGTTAKFGGEHDAHNQLASAAFMASHVGDQGGWRGLSALGGKETLLEFDRHADAHPVAEAVTTLRRAGDEKAMKLAVPYRVANGPAAAVTEAAADVDLDGLTRTTTLATLTLLEEGGDVLDSHVATRTTRWLIDAYAAPTPSCPGPQRRTTLCRSRSLRSIWFGFAGISGCSARLNRQPATGD